MKIFNILLLLFLPSSVILCQEKKDTILIKEILNDNFAIKKSYKSLPSFIREYLNKSYRKEFKISNKKFNASDINRSESTSRKLSYVAISDSKKNYILSYDHGGKGHHHHTFIFETDGNKITNFYNLITPIHKTIIELKSFFESGMCSFQSVDEI